jgi:hypothetical protein
MRLADSVVDPSEMARAGALLKSPVRRDPMWPALAAATTLALTSVAFAATAVLAPPLKTEHVDSAPG